MEFLLHDPKTNTYKLYHSLGRLCRTNGIDPVPSTRISCPCSLP